MKNILELIRREFALFWANKVLRLLFIGAPLLYGVLLGFVYGKGKVTNLPIIVVDADQSEMSSRVIQMFDDNEILNIAALRFDEIGLSKLVIEKNASAIVLIPKDFEKALLTKKYPEITTIVNTANVLTANYASSAIQLSLGTLKAGIEIETLRKQGVPEALLLASFEPFKTTFVRKNNRSTNYMYFLWPGVLATVLQQVLLLGLALSFASEYEKGTFLELAEKSKTIFNMMTVKVIPYLILSFGIWLMYWIFAIWFRVPFNENFLALTVVAGVFVLSVSYLGILVSVIIPNQLKATEVLMVIATPSFILSGFTWPLSQMPLWVQYIADVIPLTHFLEAFRILMLEKGTLSQTMPFVYNMLLIAIICAILSYIALYVVRKKMRRTII